MPSGRTEDSVERSVLAFGISFIFGFGVDSRSSLVRKKAWCFGGVDIFGAPIRGFQSEKNEKLTLSLYSFIRTLLRLLVQIILNWFDTRL